MLCRLKIIISYGRRLARELKRLTIPLPKFEAIGRNQPKIWGHVRPRRGLTLLVLVFGRNQTV